MRNTLSLILFAVAALVGLYCINGLLGAAPTPVLLISGGIAVVCILIGVALRSPQLFMPAAKPTEILPINSAGPSPHVPRPDRTPLKVEANQVDEVGRGGRGWGVMVVGIFVCALSRPVHRYLHDDPPLISLGVVVVGIIVIFVGRSIQRSSLE